MARRSEKVLQLIPVPGPNDWLSERANAVKACALVRFLAKSFLRLFLWVSLRIADREEQTSFRLIKLPKPVGKFPSKNTLPRFGNPAEIFIFPFSQNYKKQSFSGKYLDRGGTFSICFILSLSKNETILRFVKYNFGWILTKLKTSSKKKSIMLPKPIHVKL